MNFIKFKTELVVVEPENHEDLNKHKNIKFIDEFLDYCLAEKSLI